MVTCSMVGIFDEFHSVTLNIGQCQQVWSVRHYRQQLQQHRQRYSKVDGGY